MTNSMRSDNPAHDAARLGLLKRKVALSRQLLNLKKYAKMDNYRPYPKQVEFHTAGSTFAERCLGAASQSGKTLAGSMEVAYHLTGLYPDDWEGTRFKRATRWWIGGKDTKSIRGSTQKLLVGPIEESEGLGTGAIPLAYIEATAAALGAKSSLDYVKVKHVSGGTSIAFFKSYEMGRESWQADTLDGVWFDEEPPGDIYSEGKTRTNNGQRGQFTILTYTPLLGMTEVSRSFFEDRSPNQHLTVMTIQDVDHYTQEEKDQITAGYPVHERDARAKGIPMLGSGVVFPIAEETLVCDPLPIPDYWAQIIGCDFGWDHPQGWVRIAWDRDNDKVYITDVYRAKETTPAVASLALLNWTVGESKWCPPVAWPHDGYQHDKGSGLQLAEQYRDTGLNMMDTHATHSTGGFKTEPGIADMLTRMQQQRFAVFSTCSAWFDEFRLYHRKDGKIVKINDDLMSATRMAVMMLREAEVPPTRYDDYQYNNHAPRTTSAVGY